MAEAAAQPPDRPDVLLEVELVDGLLFLVLANVGGAPAHRVRARFDAPLTGVGGDRRIDRLRVFRRLEFLGPGRELRVFLDRAALFFARQEETSFEVALSWLDDRGARGSRRIRHDLDAFRDLPTLEVPLDDRRP